ncbi:MAG: hypothetical protein ABI905_03280 [Betaproteobacteria bacterium]
MRSTSRLTKATLGVFLLGVVIALALLWRRDKAAEAVTTASAGLPVIMHTAGGRLEVATVTAAEAFRLADEKELLGLDLGTTVSHIQVTAVYRYYIEMAREWPIKVRGQTAIVEANTVMVQAPVGFDTQTLQKHTASGWARFNKQENLDKLERSLSPLLEARAAGYRTQALDTARKSVSDFVTKWLLRYHPLPQGGVTCVEVLFPGESASAHPRCA